MEYLKDNWPWMSILSTIVLSIGSFISWFNPGEVALSDLSQDQKDVLIYFLDKDQSHRLNGTYLGTSLRETRELYCSGYLGGDWDCGYSLSIKGIKAARQIKDENTKHKELLAEYRE